MNKLLKGSIAGAAGIALLLGGAGTFALWSDTQAVTGAAVSTGILDIDTTATAATWADVSVDATSATWVPSADKLVPGDTVTYTKDVQITATGKNLKALLAYTASSIPIAASVAPAVTVTMGATVTSGTAAVTAGTAANTFNVVPGATNVASTIRVVITVAYSKTIPINQVGQNQAAAVDLTAPSFTITQVRP
jgi:alternate signal-mediated exported protein